jgi:pyruvate-formate lyase-activating enzyme
MNNCVFCVYRQHGTKFRDLWRHDHGRWQEEVERRLRYAANRVDSVVITSQGEPTLNMAFIGEVMEILNRAAPGLAHIEVQTSGVGLDKEKLNMLYTWGVRVVSLSLPALDTGAIAELMRIPRAYDYRPLELVALIRSMGFTLRLSLAMTKWFDDYDLTSIVHRLAVEWAPDQVSFKKLYGAPLEASTKYDKFVEEFKTHPETRKLELLSLRVWKYDLDGMGVVWNDDCMVAQEQSSPRYLILQPDGKLYTRWDSKGSVVF